MPTYLKDSDAVLDYKFDYKSFTNGRGFSDWLESGETINTFTITSASGITVDSSSKQDTNTSVIAILSGGTVGTSYTIACKIVTVGGTVVRTDERTITISVVSR